MNYVTHEAALSRVLSHGEKGFMIISAFRHEYSFPENLQRHASMLATLCAMNLCFFELVGHWNVSQPAGNWDGSQDYQFEEIIGVSELNSLDVEKGPCDQNPKRQDLSTEMQLHLEAKCATDPSVEYSLFIPYDEKFGKSYSNLLKFGMVLMDHWDQDGLIALERKTNKIVLIDRKSFMAHPFEEFSFRSISVAYTHLHQDRNQNFRFEGVTVCDTNFGCWAMAGHGYIMVENRYFVEIQRNQRLLRGEIG